MPGVAFPPVGPWDIGSPPSRPGAPSSRPSVLCSAKTANRPSRGRAGLPLLPRYLGARLSLCVPCLHKARVRGGRLLATPGAFPSTVGTPTPDIPKETIGSPKFPSHPCGGMPRSQTPVVSCILAVSHPGLLPSGHCTPSALASVPLRLSY